MRALLAAACLHVLLLACASQTPAAASSGAAADRSEWQVLNRTNFSSQIRLHPHVLLVATMPWYGESRSLMVEIEKLVASDKQELGRLKLMVVYRNSEKLLAKAIGANEGTKFIYYQRSIPFKYQGKLRARDILSSVHYIMSLRHELAPFEVLNTKEDVEAFMESTDKSVLLYESCGWFTQLAHHGSNQSDDDTLSKNYTENVDISGKTLTRDSDGPVELVIDDEGLNYDSGGQLTGSPWKGGFTLANESDSGKIENTNKGNKKLCTAPKFRQFESFYSRLTVVARESFLPPEIVRFGLITENILPSLDVVNEINPETWFLTIHYLGCTTCSVIVKEGDDLRSLVQTHHALNIKEVDIDESGGQMLFPANRPSAVLFIDRLSHSSKIRDESKLSLKLLRQYVQNNYPFHVSNTALNTSKMSSKMGSSLLKNGISDAHSETARLNAWASKLIALGDKMSVMVVNDGESISYGSSSHDNGGNPLYEILTNLLQKTRPGYRSEKTRISLVSKDGGPNLLSDDSNFKLIESLSAQASQHERTDDSFGTSDNFNDDIPEVLMDENETTGAENIDDPQAPSILEKSLSIDTDKHNAEMDDQSKSEGPDMKSDIQTKVPNDVYGSSEAGGIHTDKKPTEAVDVLVPHERKMCTDQEDSGSPNEQDDGLSVLGKECRRIEDVFYEDNTFSLDQRSEGDSEWPPHSTCSASSSLVREGKACTDEGTSTIHDDHFAGSFYFSDGGYRLLRTLTGGSRIPSLVIIDAVQQNHYVFPEQSGFSYASLQNYFDSYVNQSLPSYHRTVSSAIMSKKLPRPPFVNHDFHEANPIPQLTTSSFCPLVFGFNGCDSKTEMLSPNKENITSGWNKDVLVLFSNSWCGFCQRAELVVRELHRSFRSFMSYSDSLFANAQDLYIKDRNGDYTMKGFPAVYMIDCTSNECLHLLKSAGMEELYPTLLFFPAENKSAMAYEGEMSVTNLIEFLESHMSNSRHLLEYKGFLWKKRMTTHRDTPQAVQFHIDDKRSSSLGHDLPIHSNVATGSILTATEKLATAVPFDNAKVLIVSADSQEGLIGLIMNKQLSWDAFKNLDSSMEPIKKATLFYGGPVVQGYHLLSLSKVALEGYIQVIPDVFYGNIIATSRAITRIKSGEQSTDGLWFFLGYSGWRYSQLLDELSDGAWHISEKPIEHLDWPAS